MSKQLDQIEHQRMLYFKQYKKENQIALLLLICAMCVIYLGFYLFNMYVLIFGFVILISSFYFFSKANHHLKTFKTIIKTTLIKEMIFDKFDQASYDYKSFIHYEKIAQAGLIQKPDQYFGEDHIKGIYKGVAFEVSDVEMKERIETRDSKGHVSVSYRTYFKGRWYIYQFNQPFDAKLKIFRGRRQKAQLKGLRSMDTESIEFNKLFNVFSNNAHFMFYHLTPLMIEKFIELQKIHKGTIHIAFTNNQLHIGVNDYHNYLEVPIKKSIDQTRVSLFKKDIEIISYLVDILRLDGKKYIKKEYEESAHV